MKKGLLVIFAVLFCTSQVYAGLLDKVINAIKGDSTPSQEGESSNASSDLSNSEITSGLREALLVGVSRAVDSAHSEGGFLNNPDIHIPLPGHLQQAAGILGKFGMGSLTDTFENTMNEAASQAAGEAKPILIQTATNMTFEDVMNLWKGGDTAITDFFREKTWNALYDKFKPIVHNTGQSVGVTKAYQDVINASAVKSVIKDTSFDLDYYVTEKTLGGVFSLLAGEEKKIREDPLARTTDILKKVFGK
jgi:hypothetical protein